MCILCVVQKWSRRVATMLPWLVIPLIGLWALSQLLPPGFRFEVTSPRLACVLVLLVTLFWYEILMPQLSSWRARRSARLIEKKRFEAIEMQKLRKMATRRCRNCLTPYRDQNPGSGRFMCSYCGHISKRPVLDIPGSAGLGITNSGIIGDLVGKGGKIWNGKAWPENGWINGHDWLENGNFSPGSFTGKSNFWGKNGGGFFSGDDRCLAEESYSGVVVFFCRLLASFFLSIRWVWRKTFRVSLKDDDSSDAEKNGLLLKKGENGVNFHDRKGEKARRKAEEKRQARLERELLEEEERKQREEVARLVEEQRRLRDEIMEAEKIRIKGSSHDKEKDKKREAEKKRQERKKEKDKSSSKSNSDCEELERRIGKDGEKKREFDKRSEIERRGLQKTVIEGSRTQNSDSGNVIKVTTANNFSRGTGARYLDCVKGSFLSTSKALHGASFFGKATHLSANSVAKANKPIVSTDFIQVSANRREIHATEHVPGKLNSNGDDKINETSFHQPVGSEMQPRATPKKSWQQLFTRSPAAPSFSEANVLNGSNQKPQAEAQSSHLPGQVSPPHPLQDQIHFGQPVPFNLSPFSNGLASNRLVSSSVAEPIFPPVGKPPHEFIPEELEVFEDPCYVPDPISLLGPVSESLDSFPLDLGTGFVNDTELQRPHALKNVCASAEVNKPSPIESPMSRLRVVEERNAISSPFLNTSPSNESSDAHALGTWQMWGTTPLGQDGLGFVGGPASWLLPLGQNISNKEDIAHLSSRRPITSQFAKENQVLGAPAPQRVHLGNCQNGGTFSPLGPGKNGNDPWLQRNLFLPLSGDGENHFPPLIPLEEVSRNELTYGSSSRPATSHPSEQSPANCWSKKDWAVHDSTGDGIGNSVPARPHIGGLFSTPDVQSVWSFN